MAYAKITSASEIGADALNEIDFYCGDSNFCHTVLGDVLRKNGLCLLPDEFLIADMLPEQIIVDIYNLLFVDYGFCVDGSDIDAWER